MLKSGNTIIHIKAWTKQSKKSPYKTVCTSSIISLQLHLCTKIHVDKR